MTAPPVSACPVCGANEVRVVRQDHQVVADDGAPLVFQDEISHCERCGVDFYTRDQSLGSSRARAAVLRAHEGLLSPQEIRAIRDRLGYSQADLEHALRTGPKTVVRWEKGTVRQSRAADQLLRVLAADPVRVLETATLIAMPGPPPGTTAQATVFAAPFMLTPGVVASTTTIWSGAIELNQPMETAEEWKGVLGAAPEGVSLAA